MLVANSDKMVIDCVGCVKQCVLNNGKQTELTINKVHYVPNICANLLSVSQIVSNDNAVLFTKNGCKIYDSDWNVIATASLVNDLFKLDVVPNVKTFVAETNSKSVVTRKPKENLILWHRRLGHANFDYLKFLKDDFIKKISFSDIGKCEICIKGRHARDSFNDEGTRATKLLEIVHSDVCGPLPTKSFSGCSYFVTFIDDFSRKVFVYVIKRKSEVFDCFLRFKAMVEKQTGHSVKVLRTDNGTEYCNKSFARHFAKEGILHQKSAPYSPQQNGLAERMNRTLLNKVCCMLIDAGV